MTQESNNDKQALDPELARYSRQILYEKIGVEGQRKLGASKVVLIGSGALGTVLANTLVRAGVGFLRICDRDFIERNNLQRQILFDEDDIAANLPKAQAATRKLRRINPDVTIEAEVTDVNPDNIERLCEGMDLILDGTDNFETRFLINDYAVKNSIPWVYGAVIGATGLCMTIVPHDTPCLRCVFEDAPPPEMNPTCDTAGVLGSTVNLVASLQAIEAMKLLMGKKEEINRHLVHLDVWSGRFVNMKVQSSFKSGNCPCCNRGDYEYLSGKFSSSAVTLCGRNAVQITNPGTTSIDFSMIAKKLEPVASKPIKQNPFMLKANIDGYELTLFPDGRAIIQGIDDGEKAKSLYAKYFGA